MPAPIDLAPVAVQSGAVQPASAASRIALLRFLEGRWTGTAPDGTAFFEEYDFPGEISLRSRRFADATFSASTDGSTVTVEGSDIVSRWGEYSWRAGEMRDGFARFEPINAPSSFSWRRIDRDQVEVTQRWTDAQGQAQSYALTLRRVP